MTDCSLYTKAYTHDMEYWEEYKYKTCMANRHEKVVQKQYCFFLQHHKLLCQHSNFTKTFHFSSLIFQIFLSYI